MAVVGLAAEVAGLRAPFLQNNRRQYFRRFKVECDSVYDGPRTALTAQGLPLPYAPYVTTTEADNGAVVVSREVTQDKKLPSLFWVDVEYDTEYERKDDDPFADPPELEFDFEPYQEPLPGAPITTYGGTYAGFPDSYGAGADPRKDNVIKFGGGITNSAGEPFDPPAERESARPIIRFTRNEPNFLPAVAVKFINSVNSAAWSGLEPRVAMLKGIKGVFHLRKFNTVGKADIPYFRVSYVFALKRETWDLSLLNIGSYYLSAAATYNENGIVTNNVAKLQNIVGGKATKVLLKADGTKLGSGEEPTFRRFRVAPERNFAELSIFLNLNIDQLKPKK